MRQWDIYNFPFEKEQPHPVVIVSSDERITLRDQVNVLICTTLRGGRPLKKVEIPLNEEDGLDWPTAVQRDLVYLVDKSKLTQKRGAVVPARRRQIGHKIIESMRLLH